MGHSNVLANNIYLDRTRLLDADNKKNGNLLQSLLRLNILHQKEAYDKHIIKTSIRREMWMDCNNYILSATCTSVWYASRVSLAQPPKFNYSTNGL